MAITKNRFPVISAMSCAWAQAWAILARLGNQFDFLVLQPVETARLRLVTTRHDPLDIVISEGLERELNALRAGTSGSLSGIFGPQSTTWRINREAAIFSGAGRALLLQLADP